MGGVIQQVGARHGAAFTDATIDTVVALYSSKIQSRQVESATTDTVVALVAVDGKWLLGNVVEVSQS